MTAVPHRNAINMLRKAGVDATNHYAQHGRRGRDRDIVGIRVRNTALTLAHVKHLRMYEHAAIIALIEAAGQEKGAH
jgi:hypothetical protein